MNKRAMLWIVGLIGFGFTFLAAVNVKEPSSYALSGYSSSCSGFGNIDNWTSSSCSDSLPARLGVMALGLIILVVCGYFAEKGQARSSAWVATGHDVRFDPSKALYWCSEEGCSYESTSIAGARFHRMDTQRAKVAARTGGVGGVGAAAAASSPPQTQSSAAAPTAVPSPSGAAAATPAEATLKTCPDCAEEVKAAARKCRFCGYLFAPASASAG